METRGTLLCSQEPHLDVGETNPHRHNLFFKTTFMFYLIYFFSFFCMSLQFILYLIIYFVSVLLLFPFLLYLSILLYFPHMPTPTELLENWTATFKKRHKTTDCSEKYLNCEPHYSCDGTVRIHKVKEYAIHMVPCRIERKSSPSGFRCESTEGIDRRSCVQSSARPDRLWGQLSSLSNGYQRLFPRG
jgi:hypothetical protein